MNEKNLIKAMKKIKYLGTNIIRNDKKNLYEEKYKHSS